MEKNKENPLVPSEENIIEWCEKEAQRLERKKCEASEHVKEEQKLSDDDENDFHFEELESPPPPREPSPKAQGSLYKFPGDLRYFKEFKHPTIQQMIYISEDSGYRYERVFNRFCELRKLQGLKCLRNDTCRRVAKYFSPLTVYDGADDVTARNLMLQYFKRFNYSGPLPSTGCIHLVVDRLGLPPDLIRDYYVNWYKFSDDDTNDQNSQFDSTEWPFNVSDDFEDGMIPADMDTVQIDHDYGKSEHEKRAEILKIIRDRPDMTVAEAISLCPIYGVDLRELHATILKFQEDEEETDKTQSEAEGENSMDEEFETIQQNFDDNDDEELFVDHEEEVTLANEFPAKNNDFPSDFELFNRNRHPTIQEMIGISCRTGVDYSRVFHRFQEFRAILKEQCPSTDDPCQKVANLFAAAGTAAQPERTEIGDSVMEIFEILGSAGRYPNEGYIHVVAEKLNLSPGTVRKCYSDWLNRKNAEIQSGSGEIRVSGQLNRANPDEYLHMLNSTFLKNFEKLSNLVQEPPRRSLKRKRVSQRDANFYYYEDDDEPEYKKAETEDEDIDVVGLEGIDQSLPGPHRSTYMRSHSFPADLELFEKNRHPSIQEMIHISECFGISYEKVFIRFQDLRSIANEHCEPEDICEKVRRFSQMYPKLSGNLDEIPALHVEFEKLVRFGGTQLPIGYVHLVMEKVELEPRVIREQFMEWFRRRTKNPMSRRSSSQSAQPKICRKFKISK